MGKKRKSRVTSGQSASRDTAYYENSRFDPDEQFTDSADEFQAGRDRILLEEGPETKRRRKLAEDEELLQPSDEELHVYRSTTDGEDDFDLEDGEMDEEEHGEEDVKSSAVKRSSRIRNRATFSPSLSEDAKAAQDEDEEMGGWGSSRKDYYDADVIENEGDALEEEAEAKRIQQKKLQSMKAADFGLDETDWALSQQDEPEKHRQLEGDVITEALPELQIPDDMSVENRLRLLKQRYPEFESLSKDFVTLQPLHLELLEAFKTASLNPDADIPVSLVKGRALSAYLGAISMYFLLLTSPSRGLKERCLAMAPAELREHPIMEALVSCRTQWEEVRNLQEHGSPEAVNGEAPEENVVQAVLKARHLKVQKETISSQKPKRTKAEKAADLALKESELRRAERIRQTEAGLEELSRQLESREPRKPKSKQGTFPRSDENSDFGDETTLTAHEAAEKAKKKKSLRFYTSQIAQKANKRDVAGRDAGGDADLPYRERLKDRQARLNKEAEKRGRKEANERERLGGDSDDDDFRAAKEIRGDGRSDSEDYYDLVAARNKEKKENKKRLAEAYAEAAREGGHVEAQEEIGPDGKRAITYAIEKNKGLTPKRNKDVRNPRVKKRKKFEQKKKKLGSIRPVYKGGEGPGGYGGELTGIKKNLVKSVKL
ncbi:something about silencing protein 10 [Emydomyces testavorans]|uniref:Something about silencing protein 10 n=1 Tax=Emydomyces testavorans TaxID=2070801 RepID=A0AAF0IGK5_9EURO|nr:something about silencing protein 10 [Emydomyces testavorans]